MESAINALAVHGLDMRSDHGIAGFNAYVALAMVGRNLNRLGTILLAQEAEKEERKGKRAACRKYSISGQLPWKLLPWRSRQVRAALVCVAPISLTGQFRRKASVG